MWNENFGHAFFALGIRKIPNIKLDISLKKITSVIQRPHKVNCYMTQLYNLNCNTFFCFINFFFLFPTGYFLNFAVLWNTCVLFNNCCGFFCFFIVMMISMIVLLAPIEASSTKCFRKLSSERAHTHTHFVPKVLRWFIFVVHVDSESGKKKKKNTSVLFCDLTAK